MKALRNVFTLETVGTLLNLGGTALVAVGIYLLPIDISFRLIIEGVLAIVLFYTLSR